MTYSQDRATLDRLLELLRELECIRVPEHERPVLEVARTSLLEEIAAVSHRLRDAENSHRFGGTAEVTAG